MSNVMPNQRPMPPWLGPQTPQAPPGLGQGLPGAPEAPPMFSQDQGMGGGGAPPGGPPMGLPTPPMRQMGPQPGQGQGMGGQNGGMSADFLKQMMGGHGLASEQGEILRKRKLAEQLRADNQGLLKATTVGGQSVGPGLGQLAANLYGTYQGGKDTADLDAAQTTLSGKQSKNAEDWFQQMVAAQTQR